METGWVAVDGIRIRYLRHGRGPSLLLLHGLIGSAENWRRNVRSFAKDAMVYGIDLPNMGQSGRRKGMDSSLHAAAEFVCRIMDALGLEQADIAAHSRGGAVAITLATLYPDRVRSLVLFAPANPFCDRSRAILRFYRTRIGRGFARIVPWLPTKVKACALRRMYGDHRRVPADALQGYTVGLGLPGTIDHVMRIVRTWTTDMTWLERRLERLADVPVLLIWGDRDRAVGLESGLELQRRLRGAHLCRLDGVGHIAFEEVPELVNPIVSRWLQWVGRGPGGSPAWS